MPFWTILKIIHNLIPMRSTTTKTMIARTYMVNKEQKTIHKATVRKTYKK